MITRRKSINTRAALLCVVLLAAWTLPQNIPVAFAGDQVPIYATEEILVDPEPPLAGNPTVLCAEVSNPTPYHHTANLEFGVTPLGIGVPFAPVGESQVEVPAGGQTKGCVTWIPAGPGPWSIQVSLMIVGYDDVLLSQRNLDMDEPLKPGVPHSRAFHVGNPRASTADISLGLIPHLLGWGLELSPDVLYSVPPGSVQTVQLTVTPPADLPTNGAPIVDVEGFIGGELIGGFRKIYTREVEECEGNFDGDDDVDGSDLAVFAADFGRTDCMPVSPCWGDLNNDGDVDGSDLATFAADFGRTDCPKISPFDAMVTGRIVCPGSVPCGGSPLPGEIRVEIRNELITNSTPLESNYVFSLRVPNGSYDLVVHLDHPDLQVPPPLPVTVEAGGVFDAGEIELLPRDALIQGRVVDTAGAPLAGVRIVGFQPEGFGTGWVVTNPSGQYDMAVIGGGWVVEPRPEADQPFVFLDEPRHVRVVSGGTMRGVDFELTGAPGLIQGVAIDAFTSERIWGLEGVASGERLVFPPDGFQRFSQGILADGAFVLKAQLGWDFKIALELPPQAPYLSGSEVFTIGGLFTDVEILLFPKNAVIQGVLLDTLTQLPPVEPVGAQIYGQDDMGHWTRVLVAPDNTYSMTVAAGLWHLSVQAEPDSGYAPLALTVTVPVQPEDTVLADLEVQPINSTISGRAVAPDLTTPVPDVLVVARGNSPFGGDLNVETYTNALGEFELVVRAGTYEVTAALPPSELIARGWLNPSHLTDITVSAGSPSAGWDLPFRTLDGQIIGTVSFDPGISFDPTWMPTHPAYVWGRSADSDRAEIEAQVVTGTRTFTYAMPVLSGAMWHVGAVYEDRDNGLFYESSEVAVSVPSSTLVIQDLELKGPYPLPQPFIISFDGTQMQTIVLPDGVQLDIPGGALLTTGATSTAVTLFVLASDEKKPQPGEELVGPGYEIWAVDGDGMEIVQFNHNVTMTFSYPDDGTLELQDISEYKLIPVYYSTLEGHWIFPDSYEVDTANNEIAMNVLHF